MGKLEKVIVLSVLAVIAVILVVSLTLDDPLKKDKVVMAGNSSAKSTPAETTAKTLVDDRKEKSAVPAPNASPMVAQTSTEPPLNLQPKAGEVGKSSAGTQGIQPERNTGAVPTTLLSTTIAPPKQEAMPTSALAHPQESSVPAGSMLKTSDGLQDSYLAEMKFYTWQNGDNFRALATKYYGDPSKFTVLRRSNEGRESVQPGEKILVPVFDLDAPRPGDPSANAMAAPKSVAPSKDAANAKANAAKTADAATTGGPRVHVVKDGESLWKISKLELGDGGRWNEIFEANRDVLSKPEAVHAGLKLRVPVK